MATNNIGAGVIWMEATGDEHKALDEAFRAAFMLTGNVEIAETAVLDGIAALELIHAADEALIFESVKSAVQRRTSFRYQRARTFAHLPIELRRLFLLAPISRDCFVLRVLVGLPSAACAAVLRVPVYEIDAALFAALQDLPNLNAFGQIRSELINYMPRYDG